MNINENLEKDNKALQELGGVPAHKVDSHTQSLSDEVRRLQAQNSAIQKNMAGQHTIWMISNRLWS